VYDVYSCEICDESILVKKDKEPRHCPFCDTEALSWSHETDEL
jgi:rubrerythrin